MTDPILAQIDNVLDDFATSADAMRWTPEPQPEPRKVVLGFDGSRDGRIAMFVTRPGIVLELPRPARPRFEQIAAAVRSLSAAYNAFARGTLGAARQAGSAIAKLTHVLQNPSHDRARCRICNPFANPYPLVAGAEYRRRQQARKRSRR